MGSICIFPQRRVRSWAGTGTVHVMPSEEGGYDVSHESGSGESWGGFERFDDPQEAVAAAYWRARHDYGGCDVFVPQSIVDVLPVTPGPLVNRRDW